MAQNDDDNILDDERAQLVKTENEIIVLKDQTGDITQTVFNFVNLNRDNVNISNNTHSSTAQVTIGNMIFNIVLSENGAINANVVPLGDGNSPLSTLDIQLAGSYAQIDEEKGELVSTIDLGNGILLQAVLTVEGKVKHRVNHNDHVTEANFDLQGAFTKVDPTGNLRSQGEVIHDGFIYRAIVVTDRDGLSRSKFVKIEYATGEEIELNHTLREDTLFELGSEFKIFEVDGKIFIKVVTPLDGDLVIE
ncbi:MAG: hypothetical protein U9N49_13255 [Campylobacterota bacterium]|nr:hypothetical protein [Campylobacterota bacterium]